MEINYALKELGNIDATSLIEKTNNILQNGWNELCYDPGSVWNKMDEKFKFQLESIVIFNLPDKQNPVFQNLTVNKELLNLFQKELENITDIFDQHYPGRQATRISLNLMKPSVVFPEHTDFLHHYDSTIRIHIPITTNENVIFKFPTLNQSLHMEVGQIVEFNNSIPHSGKNDSDQNRMHLIIDYSKKDDPYYGDVEHDWRKYL